jgi:hypothetical protein
VGGLIGKGAAWRGARVEVIHERLVVEGRREMNIGKVNVYNYIFQDMHMIGDRSGSKKT